VALCLQRGDRLYGRYWGSEPTYKALHFELCYHRPIEACIENGWTRFEAGAQGSHKLKRGLRPRPTYSLHWIRHAGLRAAIADAMARETEMIERDMALLDAHAPFRKE
jgi:predicted N-acyltransferase